MNGRDYNQIQRFNYMIVIFEHMFYSENFPWHYFHNKKDKEQKLPNLDKKCINYGWSLFLFKACKGCSIKLL